MSDMEKWVEDAFDHSIDGIRSSEVFALMFSGKREDAMQCLQLGMAIMMDKPILVVGDGEVKIPKSLARIAVHVERADFKDPAALAAVMKRLSEEDVE